MRFINHTLSRMTIEQKLDYIGGFKGMNIRPMPELGLPQIVMSDGPLGLRAGGIKATAYPATIGLAASWNLKLAKAFGRAMGRDARARGVHILLIPGVNIARSPVCGRNFEYLSEDPFLAARICVPVILAVQNEGVAATVKHFACNNQEYDRNRVSSEVDERTLREMYLPAFRAAVVEANVCCVMNGYNLLNGIHCTEHDWLNNQLLRGEWGFKGFVMSDWVSTWDAVGAANGGLDIEMPSARMMNEENLLPAIRDGRVSEATIDAKIRNILGVIQRMGFLEREQKDPTIPLYDPSSAKVALGIARESVVLLKNEGGLLPLDRRKVKKLAVIGPNAHPAVWGANGSSFVKPFRATSVLDGVETRVGDRVEVFHDNGGGGIDIEPLFTSSNFSSLDPSGNVQAGLHAKYYPSWDFSGEPVIERVDGQVNLDWESKREDWLPAEGFSIRWTGFIHVAERGAYFFVGRFDDGMRVWVDGKPVIDDWAINPPRTRMADLDLEAGRHEVRIDYWDRGGSAVAQFGWGQVPVPSEEALRIARGADVAVVCVGFTPGTEGENLDRRYKLPTGQEELIRAVAAANPNTVVIVNAGSSVATAGWLDKVPGLLHAWYPGQEGGRAIAEILFGDVNPSGKLPITWERDLKDNPSTPHYLATAGKTHYREGIFVGYRGFDRKGIDPLFPFGYGLSYTAFEYRDLQIESSAADKPQTFKVSFTLKNTGARRGSEIAQIYVGRVGTSAVERPPRELKAFVKAALGKGRTKTVSATINASDLAYFNPDTGRWVIEPGCYAISIGSSSRDLRLSKEATIG